MEKVQTNQTERSEDQAQQEAHVAFPKRELKAWYASLPIESKLAAAMMMYLVVNGIGDTPDHGATGVRILRALDQNIEAADLPERLVTFRQVYDHVKLGN